ncbi:hypothetical protein SAMN05443573_102320 [Celeribacter indicus]|nr:hypothetical protein SAMN05443573_102320 [Celeribacter indicus]
MISEPKHMNAPTDTLIEDSPQWAPPEAPLDMPEQALERREARFELSRLLRLFMPGKPV